MNKEEPAQSPAVPITLSEAAAAVVVPPEATHSSLIVLAGLSALYQSFSEHSAAVDKVRPHLL